MKEIKLLNSVLLGVVGMLVPFFVGFRASKEVSCDIALSSKSIPTSVKGFRDLGVISPYVNDRGIIASVNSKGKNTVYLWLLDHRGSLGLLSIDASSGKTQQFLFPFDSGGVAVFSSLYSSQKKLYTLLNGNFVEFDPSKDAFTFHSSVTKGMAMGMTEDDQGRIWAASYPNSSLICYDPYTKHLTDYGIIHKENWPQYQRYVAADDTGWIYFTIGTTLTQIVAFNPINRETKSLIPELDRKRGGSAYLYRNQDGKIYGQAKKGEQNEWYRIYGGAIKKIGTRHIKRPVDYYITGSQNLRHLNFPDGQQIKDIDLIEKSMTVKKVDGTNQIIEFDYETEGTKGLNAITSPDKKSIVGGSSFPMRTFEYNVMDNTWVRTKAYGQSNALTTMDNLVLFAAYSGGFLITWDPKKPFTDPNVGASKGGNPNLLFRADPVINRPHRIITLSDKKTAVMGGTPAYGYTGGGLLFYDLTSDSATLLKDNDIEINQSTFSMVELGEEKILGGTTTMPGTGGEKKANFAILYIIDKDSKHIEWKGALLQGVQTYNDLTIGKKGLVYGFADSRTFFVFDPRSRTIVYKNDIPYFYGSAVGGQSHRIFVHGSNNDIYVLLSKAILKIDDTNYDLDLVAQSPVAITAGGAFLDNTIYFVSNSHLFSYGL